MMQATARGEEQHVFSETIVSASDAMPLVRFIEQHCPKQGRTSATGILLLSVRQRDEAARAGNDLLHKMHADQIVHCYPFALNEVRSLLAEQDERAAQGSCVEVASTADLPVRDLATATALTAPLVLPSVVPVQYETPGLGTAPPAELTDAVLSAAPQLFQLERMTTGVAAVVFEFVRRERLYEQAGFASMAEYAAAALRVTAKANYKQYARAGTAMWTHFPANAQRVIEAVGRGLHVYPPPTLPAVPSVSLLRELPRALRRADVSEHPGILARVEAGQCTHEELRALGRGEPGSVEVEEDDPQTASPPADGPDVFNDVPDLHEASRLMREARRILDTLASVWTENPGADVTPLVPAVRTVVGKLDTLSAQLEDEMIPRATCPACHGAGEGCDGCSGAGWLSRAGMAAGDAQ